MGKYLTISSPQHLKTVLAENKYVFIDFTAVWCPPCRLIAPVFEKLAAANTRDGKFAFAKVDVDDQAEIAREYGITAMPTFILLEDGKVAQSIRGAHPPTITTLVTATAQKVEKLVAAEEKANAAKKEEPQKTEGEEQTVSGSYTMSFEFELENGSLRRTLGDD
jgi:thioredoxin 1